jgi:hypothetical protein
MHLNTDVSERQAEAVEQAGGEMLEAVVKLAKSH